MVAIYGLKNTHTIVSIDNPLGYQYLWNAAATAVREALNHITPHHTITMPYMSSGPNPHRYQSPLPTRTHRMQTATMSRPWTPPHPAAVGLPTNHPPDHHPREYQQRYSTQEPPLMHTHHRIADTMIPAPPRSLSERPNPLHSPRREPQMTYQSPSIMQRQGHPTDHNPHWEDNPTNIRRMLREDSMLMRHPERQAL